MGSVLSSKRRPDGKIVAEVLMDYEEYLELKGHINNIYMFSEEISDADARISLRGKNEATKYFLIPKSLRRSLVFNSKVTCQKIENNTKVFFIYTVDKITL